MNPISYSRCFHRVYVNNSCSKYIRRRDNGLSHPSKATESLQTRHHLLSSGTFYPPASKSVNPQSHINHRYFTGGGGRLSQHIQQAIRETAKRKGDDQSKQTTKPTSPKTTVTSPLPRSSNHTSTHFRDNPRTIQVKPASSSNKAQPRVGTIVNRFALNRELQDSQGTTIWLPSPQQQHHYPTIRAMAVLDPVAYLKRSRSAAGPEATRRLLYGKRDVVMILRSAARKGLRVQLAGHGVPHQLWSFVLDAAVEEWMSSAGEREMVVEEVEAEMVRWIFRNDTTGDITEAVQQFSYKLKLYWTTMRRIASRLAPVVLFRPRRTSTKSGVDPSRCHALFIRQDSVDEDEMGHQISMEWNLDETSMTIILEGRGAELRFTATFSQSKLPV